MKNIRVLYASKTGHSKKLADAVAAALGVSAENALNRPALKQVDLLVLAGGIYGGQSLPEFLDYLKTLDGSTIAKAALITSSASNAKGQDDARRILNEKGIEVAGEFRCSGGFLFVKMGHPNKSEIQHAVEFVLNCTKG